MRTTIYWQPLSSKEYEVLGNVLILVAFYGRHCIYNATWYPDEGWLIDAPYTQSGNRPAHESETIVGWVEDSSIFVKTFPEDPMDELPPEGAWCVPTPGE